MEAIVNGHAGNAAQPRAARNDAPALPAVVDRAKWQAQVDELLVREKAHTREGDAIAAAPATAALAQDNGEWKDTEIHFEITARDGKTEIGFPHAGLVPDYECFDVCSSSWGFYLYTSLRALIRTGHGLPNRKEQVAFA